MNSGCEYWIVASTLWYYLHYDRADLERFDIYFTSPELRHGSSYNDVFRPFCLVRFPLDSCANIYIFLKFETKSSYG